MALTAAQKLEQAKAALHELLIGRRIVSGSFEGRTVQYRAQDIPQLRTYIRELEAEISPTTARKPFGVVW